jgi:hypothetical protein
MTNNIKELVKRHFNLVEATAEEAFAMIKSADGELELTYEGESLAEGLEIFVITADGNVAAPDGEHSLEGGITIITKDGKIESIMETPAEAKEEAAEEEEEMEEKDVEESLEEDAEEALEDEDEEMEDEVAEELEEEVEEVLEDEVIIAVVEAVRDAVEEMTKEMRERMDELEGKYASFSSAPASEKTIASSVSKKSKKESYKNQSRIDEIIARKKN